MKNDYQTNTVNGAQGFESINCELYRDDTPLLRDLIEENEEIEQDYECNCSDPGCPCGGFKFGSL